MQVQEVQGAMCNVQLPDEGVERGEKGDVYEQARTVGRISSP